MAGSKYFEKIAWCVTALALVLTALFMNGAVLGISAAERTLGYETRLFDRSRVHTVDILMDEWDDLIANAASEEYYAASVVIDGEAFKNVGIRTKGNTSLSNVASLDSERYSFKIEFDHYDSTKTYYGLDKLCLNNLIQDATMMKDYLTYTMMYDFGVNASLCSYVFITVNGEDWGLYLAVEGVEDAFLTRNYGADHGTLYKPDSLSFGGGGGGMSSSDVKLQYIDDDPESYSNIWENAKTDLSTADQERLIASLQQLSQEENLAQVVDMEQVLRYFVVHNYVCNGDSYTGSMVHNYYLYEKDGKLAMLPWDYNLAFGTFQATNADSVVNTAIDAPVDGGSDTDRPMWSWILSDETYLQAYHDYFSEFLNTVDIQRYIDETAALIQPYVASDPTAFYTLEEFNAGVAALGEFCRLRSQSISTQLETGITTQTMHYADASDLNLSDMGSMNGGGGEMFRAFDKNVGGMTQPEEGVEFPSIPGQNDDNGQMPESREDMNGQNLGELPENGETPSDFGDFGGRENGEKTEGDLPENGEMPSDFGGFGGRENGEKTEGELPENGEMPSDFGGFGGRENGEMTEGEFPDADGMNRPNGGNFQLPADMGEGMFGKTETQRQDQTLSLWIWVGVSVAVLAIGLLIAKRYPR